MQHNRPGTNNPINPLQKVAALTVKRDEDRLMNTKHETVLPVVASLSFQKSTHMEGRAVDKAGDPVTIRFSMAVRQALLQLTAAFAEGAPSSGTLMVSEVAHQMPLAKAKKVTIDATR